MGSMTTLVGVVRTGRPIRNVAPFTPRRARGAWGLAETERRHPPPTPGPFADGPLYSVLSSSLESVGREADLVMPSPVGQFPERVLSAPRNLCSTLRAYGKLSISGPMRTNGPGYGRRRGPLRERRIAQICELVPRPNPSGARRLRTRATTIISATTTLTLFVDGSPLAPVPPL